MQFHPNNMLWEIIGIYMIILLYVHKKINIYIRKTVHLCTLCLVGILPIFPTVCVAHRRSWFHGELCLATNQMSHKS